MKVPRLRFTVASALLAACASAPSPKPAAPALSPARLYPMPAGSAWSYDVETGEGPPVLAITRVIESAPDRATVQSGESTIAYVLRADGIFREDRGGYLLKSPIHVGASWPSGGGVQASVQRTDVALETKAGHFSGCVEVLEQGSPSGAVVTTTYCPDVGPARVVSSMQLALAAEGGVQVVAQLRGYQIGGAAPAAAPAKTSLPAPDRSP